MKIRTEQKDRIPSIRELQDFTTLLYLAAEEREGQSRRYGPAAEGRIDISNINLSQ